MKIDWQFIHKPGALTIILIAILHLLQACLVSLWSSSVKATVLMAVRDVMSAAGIYHRWLLSVLLVSAASCAIYGAVGTSLGKRRIWWLFPQQFALGIMAGGGLAAAALGTYLDGVVVPWPHILAEQAVFSALFLIHIVVSVRRCWVD